MKFFVYELINPETSEVRYIGKTNNTKRRKRQHLSTARTLARVAKCSCWIRSLLAKGIEPELRIITEVESECEANKLEMEFIKRAKEAGVRLTNLTDGGEGQSGRKWEEESKIRLRKSLELLSKTKRGSKRSPEIGRKISKTKKGVKLSKDHIAKISEAKSGKKHSQEHCENISKALKGKQKSKEHIKKVAEKNRARHSELRMYSPTPRPKQKRGGSVMSEDAKKKLSKDRKGAGNPMFGRQLSEEAKAHLSKVTTGISRGEAFKEKCRQAWVLRKSKVTT
jgi:hypothetical protein